MSNSAAGGRSPLGLFPGQPDRVVEALRSRHYSHRTERAYLHWIRRFLAFHDGTHPRELAEKDLNRFLTHLAIGETVAASTQNQALAAVREWVWQWVFPASSHYLDRETGIRHRHHLHESVIQKAVHQAAQRAGLAKRVTTHAFRHSFAAHPLEDGYEIRTVQELLGHKDVQTTMVYTHVLNRGGRGVRGRT